MAGKTWAQLKDWVEILLRDGKRSQHEDFQLLFRIFGEDKVRKMAQDILAKWRESGDKDG